MKTLANPYRGTGLAHATLAGVPAPSSDFMAVEALLKLCPHAGVTPLHDASDLAAALGVGSVHIKDESNRMGLGSFKALGAAYVVAHLAKVDGRDLSKETFITASAGNHGQSLAVGASAFGAASIVYIAETVPAVFADRLSALGATVVREGATYEDSMAAAAKRANDEGLILLSDTSWSGYTTLPHRLKEGYTAMMAEVDRQMSAPTHVFLQAGVGGLACAGAAMVRALWGDDPTVIVVEPEFAPALYASIQAGGPVVTDGLVSDMGRLDCAEPSLIALKGLAKDADHFQLITEDEGQAGADLAAHHGLASTTSGAAGLSGLLRADPAYGLDTNSCVLLILSEGPE